MFSFLKFCWCTSSGQMFLKNPIVYGFCACINRVWGLEEKLNLPLNPQTFLHPASIKKKELGWEVISFLYFRNCRYFWNYFKSHIVKKKLLVPFITAYAHFYRAGACGTVVVPVMRYVKKKNFFSTFKRKNEMHF